jgi:mannose-1-phosphate guanylyltransferase/mannose-6-phosphate isomerase
MQAKDDVMDKRRTIFPVLLSGGAGSRLWPLSREGAPKQLIRLIGDRTLLQQTALRAADAELFEPLTVIAGYGHRFAVAEQLSAIGASPASIVLEPAPRSTAAAAAIAALLIARSRPDATMLLMPADHLINDPDAFRRTVREAAETARQGYLTLFGIRPDSPATGYGYIRVGEPLSDGPARSVSAFVEKPDETTAAAYLESGEYLWNSGIFLLPVALFLAELGRLEPELLSSAGEALDRAATDADFVRLDAEAFGRCRSVSIDYAVMERTGKAAVVPAEFSWMDVGSWSSLWWLAERDDGGNAVIGDVMTFDTRGSYIRSEGPVVATLGVEDLIIVATNEAVLVAKRDRDQEIGKFVKLIQIQDPKCL